MKDATNAARIERAIATLEIVVGRLDRLTGSLVSPPDSPASQLASGEPPPLSSEQEEEIDKFIKRRLDEIEFDREKRGPEYALGD